jgi:hypothetical protein
MMNKTLHTIEDKILFISQQLNEEVLEQYYSGSPTLQQLEEVYLKLDEEKTDELYFRFCSGDICDEELQDSYRKLSLTGKAIIQMENLLERRNHETPKFYIPNSKA